MELRAYQLDAIAAIRGAVAQGNRRPLLELATGLGKTVVFSRIVHSAWSKGRRSLILAHRDELISQAVSKLEAADPTLWFDVGIVKAGDDAHDRPIVVASVQTLARQRRLERVAPTFDVVVIDEAHHAASDSYLRILEHLGCLGERPSPVTLGVTATPERADKRTVTTVFDQGVVYRYGLVDAIRDRWLVDLRGVAVRLAGLDIDRLQVVRGDFALEPAGDALRSAEAPRYAVDAYLEHAEGRTGVVFAATIALSRDMADAFNARGVPAEHLDGNTPRDQRRAILDRLRRGETRIVSNAMVLTEGWDEPSIGVVVNARPTRHRSTYLQMIGRGTRPHDGKDDCLVIDLCGASDRHDLVSLPRAIGTRSPKDDKPFAARAALAEAEEEADEEERLVVARAQELLLESSLAWVSVHPGTYALDTREGAILLWRAGGVWKIGQLRGTVRPLGEDADLRRAERIARRALPDDVARHAKRTADWRARPATAAQLSSLRTRGVLAAGNLTRGEASDEFTRRRLRHALQEVS